jgi:NADH-quinone oxidoreductase subunit G
MLEDDRLVRELGNLLSNTTAVVHATLMTDSLSSAAVVLPAASSVESEGTFINCDGIPQQTRLAKQVVQMTPEMWMRLPKGRLDKAAVAVDKWRTLENVQDVLPSWLLIAHIAKSMGEELGYKEHHEIFSRLKHDLPALRDFTFSYKVPKEAFKISQFEFAVK